jgi:putative DNA-invertase from lambdoid prophage Rac
VNSGRSCWRRRAAARSTWCWCGGWIAGAGRSRTLRLRSEQALLATLQELEHLGIGFVSLTEALDLTTPAGRAMAGLLAVFAEFEREILRERVRAGLAQARQNGQRLGRPVTAALHADQVRKLYRAAISKAEIARRLKIGRTSVRRILALKEP